MQERLAVLLASARLPFLVLTPVSILLGLACALTVTQVVDWLKLAIILLTAMSAHVSVNALNEYGDFRIGLDAVTEKTPFSGGSGALPAHPKEARSVLLLGAGALIVTILGGLYLVSVSGTELLVVGLFGVLIVAGYSPWMTRSPFLSLVMPGVAFGPIMVAGTAWVLAQQVTLTTMMASMATFFLVNNLLLLNQYPDIEADRAFGRRNLPIQAGTGVSAIVYILFTLLAAMMILTGILLGRMPGISIISLIPLLFALPVSPRAAQRVGQKEKLVALLGLNVAVTLLVPLMLALSMLMA
ncbi:MAG: prenyltransferase [Gammaproteobacteria bacterium]